MIDRYFVGHDDQPEYVFDQWKLQSHDWKDEEDIARLSLQCEARGPDLELYEMMRKRRRQ